MTEKLEHFLPIKKMLTLGKKELAYKDLSLEDITELEIYTLEIIEKNYKESLKLCELIPIKEEQDKTKSEIIQAYIKAKMNPGDTAVARSNAINVYMIYLCLGKKIKLSEAIKWATVENVTLIQGGGETEKN